MVDLGGGVQAIDWLAVAPVLVVACAAVVVLLADAFAGPPRSRGAGARARRAHPGRRGRGRRRRGAAVGGRPRHVLRRRRPGGPGGVLLRGGPGDPGVLGGGALRDRGGRAARHRRRGRGPHPAGGVELPAALLRDRRDGDRRLPRPGHPGGRARGGLPARVRDGRPAPGRSPRGRGVDEVLPGLGGLHRGDADGCLAGVRRHRVDVPRPRSTRPSSPAPGRARWPWSGALLTVVGLAFKVAAVPFHMWVPDTYVGAPGRGRGLPLGGVQGGRLRRADAGARPRAAGPRHGLGAARGGARGADHDRRQRAGAAAAARGAAARLVVGGAGRVHAGAVRRGRRGPPGRAAWSRSAPRSGTSRSTRS